MPTAAAPSPDVSTEPSPSPARGAPDTAPVPTRGAPEPPRGAFKAWLWLEMLGLFFAGPLALWWIRERIPGLLIPMLLGLGVLCFGYLRFAPGFRTMSIFEPSALRAQMTRILRHFAIGAPLVALLAWWWAPERLFELIQTRPLLWLAIVLFYPLLSVYPQEIVYRAFFFHRYERLFRREWALIVVNGLAFGVAHVFFGNWLAPALTALGGMLFAFTYSRARSLLPVVVEHGLWGDFIFTIGLGWFFYSGSINGG